MKLWQKNTVTNAVVEKFTVGNDREMDFYLAKFDVLGSLAHTKMLESIDLLSSEELEIIHLELKKIYHQIEQGNFSMDENVEDIHSQIEFMLTQAIGEAGKKIHSGRSRNDQVMVDLKLYFRYEIEQMVLETQELFQLLLKQSVTYQYDLLPGYTHLQIAMPSSFGLWFGAFAESLVDDMWMMHAAWRVSNKNPLGSAAGYGSSFPLNRTFTTQLLGFQDLNYNVVYAQMGRGKTERIVAQALSSIAATLGKMAMDMCLFMNQNFGFVRFPDELTTGSSIMPHKKNPDVWELIRSRCNKIQALPNEIAMMTINLPSGYHRDLQLLKESLFPAFQSLKECIQLAHHMLLHIQIQKDLLKDSKYIHLFSVESVNQLVLKGVPFREAYKTVGLDIEAGNYQVPKAIEHTHEGSIGNLCNDEIQSMMNDVLATFQFEKVHQAIESLLK